MAEYFPGIDPDFSSLAEKPDDDKDKKDKKEAKKEKRPSLFELLKEPEKKEKPEPPLEKLADDEKQLVVKARIQEVSKELETAPADTSAEKEALMAATFLEALEVRMADGEAIEEALNSSEADALDIAGLEEPSEEVDETPAEKANQPGPEPEIIEEEEPPDPIIPPVPPTAPLPPPPVPPAGHGPVGLPPPPPPPRGPTPPPPGGPGLPPFGPAGPGGPTLVAHNVLTAQPTETIDRRPNVAGYFMLGSVIGYLIGRRRGRINTEKELLPVQEKLEQEVTSLQQKIAEREAKIRNITREKLAEKPELNEKLIDRMHELQKLKESKETLEATLAPTKRPEQIGKLIFSAEKPAESKTQLDVMTVPELLVVAERIAVEDSTVKRLFETNKLDQLGLRRVVEAYLRGGSFENILRENLLSTDSLSSPEKLPKETPDLSLNASSNSSETAPKSASQLEQMIASASKDIHSASGLHIFDEPLTKPTKSSIISIAVAAGIAIAILIVLFLMTR